MTDDRTRTDDAARAVFGGLVPRTADGAPARVRPRSRRSTMPMVIAGTVAAATLTGPILQSLPRDAAPDAVPAPDADAEGARADVQAPVVTLVASTRPAAQTSAAAFATAAAMPATYKVVTGDTVSGIAARFGLSTTTVLSLNGLSWKSIIFPGQVLKLGGSVTQAPAASAPAVTPAAQVSASGTYTVQRGDTISRIAAAHRVAVQAVLDANRLSWTSIIYPGQVLRMPGGSSPIQLVSNVTPVAPKPVVTPTPAPAKPAAQPAPSTTYTIRSGDTLSAIATRSGVSLQALLAANGLTLGSVIYAGRTLTIPGSGAAVTTAAGTVTGIISGGVTPLTNEMRQNAAVIVQVGRSLGVPEYGLVVALSAAMQESSLRNLSYGDRDSVGLFQQRPSAGWGTKDQLMDPAYAAKLFFGGPQNPNAPRTRGLLDIPGWQSMTVTRAAQAVQISAYPDAYAKWETSARAWLTQL